MTVAGRRTLGGLGRDFLGIVASLSALIALPFVFGAMFVGLVSVGVISGWKVDADLAKPTPMGFMAPAGGPVIALLPACHTEPFQILLLLDVNNEVLWEAEAAEPVLVTQFFVGMAPTGFTESQALSGTLDPAATYSMQVVARPLEGLDELADPDVLAELTGGAQGTFTPGGLNTDATLVAGETQSQEEFDSSCDE